MSTPNLQRRISLVQATVINMIDMVGIGPFVVMPLVIGLVGSSLFLGAVGFIFSLKFKLSDVISAILAMRILVQFVAQAIGVVLLRKKYGTTKLPFKMWLYPLPVIVSVLCWLFVFYSTGYYAWWGVFIAAIGLCVYFIFYRVNKI